MTMLLALFGFAPTADQQRIPPAIAWGLLLTACYFAAWVVELVAHLLPTLSVYFRTIGLLATVLMVQGFVRVVFFRDGLSWSGWLREQVK